MTPVNSRLDMVLSIVLNYATLLFCSITYIYLVRVGLYRIHDIVIGRLKLDIAFYTRLLVQTQRRAVKRLQTLRVSLSTLELSRYAYQTRLSPTLYTLPEPNSVSSLFDLSTPSSTKPERIRFTNRSRI